MPNVPIEALSPRSANLPMKPPAAIKKTKTATQSKPTQSTINPDKIDERWRPANMIREPGPDGDTYLTGKKLGRGGFAVCFEGRSERTGDVVALKVVKSKVAQKKQLEKFRTELQIHAKMHHPSIVEFYRAFAFEEYTYVVLELCPNGSLMDMVKIRRSLSLPEVRRYMIQLCGGVKYMHQRCVIHRDLKMGNIFIDAQMNIKIGDFGLAAVVIDEKERRQTMCGTPNYIAPELLMKSSASTGHGQKVDTWAIGIICYAMIIGTPPFASKSQTEIYEKLKQLQYEWKEDCQYFVPNQAKDLVTMCLNLVPTERPGMDDLVEHEFFKMGAIAEDLDRSCLRTTPPWLEHADPRGDKVTAGYGVDHAAICRACGVGKTTTGLTRPSVGRNVNRSAMAEVELENAKGCAPIIPMPEGVIYKEFAAAKEDWNSVRKRPLTAPKVRSRKEPASTSATLDKKPSSRALPECESSGSTTTSVPPGFTTAAPHPLQQRAPVQSFAAQQRQQALPSRALSRRVVTTALAERERAPESERQQSSQTEGDKKEEKAIRSSQTSRGFLRERPVRAVSRITRSTSSRETTHDLPAPTSKPIQVPDRKGVLATPSEVETLPIRARSARATAASRTASKTIVSSETRPDQSTSARPSSPSSAKIPAAAPLKALDANNRQLDSAPSVPMTLGAETLKPKIPASDFHANTTLIAPNEISTPVPGSSPGDVVDSLREMYRDLSPKTAAQTNHPTPYQSNSSNPHPVVEKWVDYSERYGIGYILSDGSAGIALRSSGDNTKTCTFAVVRNTREHYPRRVRGEELQIVPQGRHALPVDFYESSHGAGIRKLQVPAREFRYNDPQPAKSVTSREVIAELTKQATEDFAAEKVRMVVLLDKFGKYMTGFNSSSETTETAETKAESFVRFYQRLGNVGIWGFGDGAFQFNFPDHTKLLLYRSSKQQGRRLMLDLYHLQPDDAVYLAKYGSMTERSMVDRDSITEPVSEFFLTDDPKRVDILTSNEVLEKLSWVRAVVGMWVTEGGLGKSTKENLAWAGLQDKATERGKKAARMVWVTVGREGGDGEISKRK